MRIAGARLKTRKISFHKGKKSPYHAAIMAAGRFIYLGYYKTRQDAEIACKAARKALPALPAGRPPISEGKCRAILETYRQLKSQAKTAQAHGVSEKTVQRLCHAARPTLEHYPDTHTALI
jgi:hypothetical protein